VKRLEEKVLGKKVRLIVNTLSAKGAFSGDEMRM